MDLKPMLCLKSYGKWETDPSCDQVWELNLLLPYLELLGLEKIKELTDKGTGQPLADNPQIFLGQI